MIKDKKKEQQANIDRILKHFDVYEKNILNDKGLMLALERLAEK